MKKSLEIMKLVTQDIFTSVFMKTIYKILTGMMVCWALCVPSLMVIDIYSTIPILKYITQRESCPEARWIDTVEDGVIVEEGAYLEAFKTTYESPLEFLLGIIAGAIALFLVFVPLFLLFFVGLVIFFIVWGIRSVIDFFYYLPRQIRTYRMKLEDRLNEG